MAKVIIAPHGITPSWYAVDGWAVTFDTARRGVGGAAALLAVPNVTAHPSTANVPITVLQKKWSVALRL